MDVLFLVAEDAWDRKVKRVLLFAMMLPMLMPLMPAQVQAQAQDQQAYLLRAVEGMESLLPPGAQHLFGSWWRVSADPYTMQALAAYGIYVEADGTVSVDLVPNDPYYLKPAPASHGVGAIRQWWLDKISVPDAWDVATAAGVKIAVVDTGYSAHPDLPAPRGEWDFVENDGRAQDEHGHGTHVMGIIGAIANNNVGIAGAASGADFYVYRVMGASGSGSVSDLATAIISATAAGAQVLSISAGTRTNYNILKDAIDAARAAGVVTVCAAGNNASNADFYPAVYCDIAVAAVDERDRKAPFSNFGWWWVDVAAPGVNILSTMPLSHTYLTQSGYYTEYDAMSGTSMSTPQVAAVVALALKASRCSGPASCMDLIVSTADRTTGTGTYWSGGRINAVAALLSEPRPTPTPWLPTPTPTRFPPTPTPVPTPAPTPFVPPPPAVLPPWGITMSLPVILTPVRDSDGNPIVGLSSGFVQAKTGVDRVLGGVVDALEAANSVLDNLYEEVGSSAWGEEALGIVSGTIQMQSEEVRGQSTQLLIQGAGAEAAQAQVSVLSALAGEPPTLQEAAALIGISAAQPIHYLRGWGMLLATASDNPHGQIFTFISAMIGLIILVLSLWILVAIIRYILLPVANALWNLLRDIWNSIPFV